LLTLTAPSLAALDQAIRAAKTSISSVTGPLFGIWPARLEGRFTDTHIFDKDGVIAGLVITVKVPRPEAVATYGLSLIGRSLHEVFRGSGCFVRRDDGMPRR
jgi:hypothetical protein